MVRRLRSLSIALVIVLASCALSGQQPKRKSEPYIAPLLPAEQAWTTRLPASPAADAVMDSTTVYVALEPASRGEEEDETASSAAAAVVALDRATGARRWTAAVASSQPPVVTEQAVIVATSAGIEALDPQNGTRIWALPLDRVVRAPIIVQNALLIAMLDGEELIGVHLDRREIAWRQPIGETGPLLMIADSEAAYVAGRAGLVMRVLLADGRIDWRTPLAGELTSLSVEGDRLFVGSSDSPPSFWSLDTRTGQEKWAWHGRVFGGAVAGSAAEGNRVYVTSWDNIVRALDFNNGNQRWRQAAGTRPLFPPRLLEGVVVVAGVAPALATFRADTGAAISTWSAPAGTLLQGPPLIDDPAPFGVAVVVVFRDGQVVGLRPVEMLFKEPALAPFATLPGRPLPRER